MIKKYNSVFALWPEYIVEIDLLLDQKLKGKDENKVSKKDKN